MTELNPTCRIDSLNQLYDFAATVDVLRLDLLHPVVSGNKWFKLQHYLREAKKGKKALLTFGGAFSNHIVATAAAATGAGLKSIGVIRGEPGPVQSHTLLAAHGYGMQLYHTDRVAYREKIIPAAVCRDYDASHLYPIPEGGYGAKGVTGAGDILRKNKVEKYTHILSAVGTGTTLAGLTMAAGEHQQVVGISALKNSFSLAEEIRHLLPPEKWNAFSLLHDYHFGGYARKTPQLISFMNELYQKTGIPTDFVYTAKSFFAAFHLMQRGYFTASDKILLIHTGGLQGNLSLPKGTLIFG